MFPAKVKEIRSGHLNARDYPVPTDTPLILSDLIAKCWSIDPIERPTIRDISRTLIHLAPHSDVSVTEGILRRMEQYNQELEATVNARKAALHAEMEKVDDLLSNILPRSATSMKSAFYYSNTKP